MSDIGPPTSSTYPLSEDLYEDMLSAEDFAVLLGLRESIDGREIPKGEEILRLQVLRVFIKRNWKESQAQKDRVDSRFCALYLPATVDRYLDPWPLSPTTSGFEQGKVVIRLQTACLGMLMEVQYNPYFAKYLRSTKSVAEGKMALCRVVAERLLELAPIWDYLVVFKSTNTERQRSQEKVLDFVANVMFFICTILTTYISYPDQDAIIPAVTKIALKPFLLSWESHYTEANLGDACRQLVILLFFPPGEKVPLLTDIKKIKRRMKGWEACGYPPCENAETKYMKACSKCQTVCYCSAEHQQLHWRMPSESGQAHKELCHRSEY